MCSIAAFAASSRDRFWLVRWFMDAEVSRSTTVLAGGRAPGTDVAIFLPQRSVQLGWASDNFQVDQSSFLSVSISENLLKRILDWDHWWLVTCDFENLRVGELGEATMPADRRSD